MKIQEQLLQLGITKYHIDTNGQITVYESINWANSGLRQFPIKLYQVWGDVDISDNLLESLENSPAYIYGNFNCNGNNLTTFQNGPFFVQKRINCLDNKNLKSIDYWPLNGLQNQFSIIDKRFGATQIAIYDYCIKNFFWKPEFTFVENVEMLLKFKPEALTELHQYLEAIPDLQLQNFRGAVQATGLGII